MYGKGTELSQVGLISNGKSLKTKLFLYAKLYNIAENRYNTLIRTINIIIYVLNTFIAITHIGLSINNGFLPSQTLQFANNVITSVTSLIITLLGNIIKDFNLQSNAISSKIASEKFNLLYTDIENLSYEKNKNDEYIANFYKSINIKVDTILKDPTIIQPNNLSTNIKNNFTEFYSKYKKNLNYVDQTINDQVFNTIMI